ncbi:MAG: hypothetical protein ACYTHK_00805 [Planctomycetota bacterium]|jgi:tetratricopeptide (TPR) repeat protein
MSRTIVLLLIAAGCASAEKSFEKARKAEAEGRWGAAADLYIDALKRDPEYPGARDGLRVAGNRAIEDSMKLARQLEGNNRFESAAEEYVRTDDLVRRAAGVRVSLTVPADYSSRRRTTFDRVVESTLAEADRLAGQGLFEDAAATYRRAVARFDPSMKQRDRADAGRFAALVSAARRELEAGRLDLAQSFADDALMVYGTESSRSGDAVQLQGTIRTARYRALVDAAEERRTAGKFQEAFSIVGEALEVYGADAPESEDARALRERIITEGTVQVAFTPVWRLDRVARHLPAGLLDEINDNLDGYWSKPPLFVEPLDSRLVRGELRRLGLDRLVLTDRQVSAVGQMLGAEFAIMTEIAQVGIDRGETPEKRPVKVKDGPDAEILLYRRRTLALRCNYHVVRVADSRLVADGTVSADVARKARHAVYDGDRSVLLLTQEEHRWFDRRRLAEVDRALEREAASILADGLAAAVYEEVTRRLP